MVIAAAEPTDVGASRASKKNASATAHTPAFVSLRQRWRGIDRIAMAMTRLLHSHPYVCSARFHPVEHSTIRVVVAEDDPRLLGRISRFIDSIEGITCVGTAQDGQSAVELAKNQVPDVILMDLRMPVMDGIRATEAIIAAGLRSRVIALTMFDDDVTFHKALLAGVSGFVLKESFGQVIGRAIQEVHGGDAVLSPSLMTRVLSRYEATIDRPDKISHLTDRELRLLGCVGRGLSNDEIADELDLSPFTVKSYISRLLAKVNCRDRAQLAILAYRSGAVTPSEVRYGVQ